MMIIIWGSCWRKKYIQVVNYGCVVCYDSMLNVYSMRTWFTFFFIPIFPTSDPEFYLECPSCENFRALKEVDVEEFLDQFGMSE